MANLASPILIVEDDPANPERILTVRGFGYRFAEPDEG
jgi:DNA-binding response OmpR family regulator